MHACMHDPSKNADYRSRVRNLYDDSPGVGKLELEVKLARSYIASQISSVKDRAGEAGQQYGIATLSPPKEARDRTSCKRNRGSI